MASKKFDQIAKAQFGFLIKDYDFKLIELREEEWGYDLTYLNNTTGVKIIYEYREAYIFIMLYKLLDGKLIENPRNVKDDTILYGYSLDDIVDLQNAKANMKPAYEYGDESEYHDEKNGMMLYVSKFADNLKEFANEVLTGNFEIFKKVDKIVKDRARQYQ
jgi:hypothetical protein